jgi:hypothetical protein
MIAQAYPESGRRNPAIDARDDQRALVDDVTSVRCRRPMPPCQVQSSEGATVPRLHDPDLLSRHAAQVALVSRYRSAPRSARHLPAITTADHRARPGPTGGRCMLTGGTFARRFGGSCEHRGCAYLGKWAATQVIARFAASTVGWGSGTGSPTIEGGALGCAAGPTELGTLEGVHRHGEVEK